MTRLTAALPLAAGLPASPALDSYLASDITIWAADPVLVDAIPPLSGPDFDDHRRPGNG